MGLNGWDLVRKLTDNPGGFAATAATFHFSMLGFLAAFLAIAVAIGQTPAFNSYRKNGNLVVQLCLVCLTMVELVFGFIFSMLMMTAIVGQGLVILNIYMIAVCLIMILVSLSPIVFMLLQITSSDG
jgi:hypothetical protein